MNNRLVSNWFAALPKPRDGTSSANRRFWPLALALAWILLLLPLLFFGCSSGSDSTPTIPPGPTSSGLVTVGPISAFGSVHANGVAYETASAMVDMNGTPGRVDDLEVGMMVSIRGIVNGSTNAVTAREIVFADEVQGIVTAVDTDESSIEVLGQTVMIDELTVMEGVPLDELAPGNVIRVSGQHRNQERIQARHVERIAEQYMAGMEIHAKGEIKGLDIGLNRFTIGTQTCDYSNAMQDLGGMPLANGMYVDVSSHAALSNGIMLLNRVATRDRDRDRLRLCSADCDFELEGYVTLFVSPAEFEVDGSPVSATDSTIYLKGTVDDLKLDAKVAIDGTLDADGVLIADRIVFRLPAVVAVDADVESIDLANATVTALGITINTTDTTMFRDDSTADLREFGLADLAIGDRVEVRAYLDGDSVVAARLDRDDPSTTVRLRAPVQAIARPELTMLGVSVMSDENTVYQNEAKEVIDADQFFALVTVNSLVLAEGTYDGASILAAKLFLRVCEDNCR